MSEPCAHPRCAARWPVWLAALLLCLIPATGRAQPWLAASSMANDETAIATHAWAVIPQSAAGPGAEPGWYLLHIPSRRTPPVPGSGAHPAPGGTVRVAARLPAAPAALAAVENRVYLIIEPRPEAPAGTLRSVLSMAAVPSGIGDLWTFEPVDRFKNDPALPGTGRLVSFAGGPRGPVALIEQPAPADSRAPPASPRYQLLLLGDRGWDPIPLPPGISDQSNLTDLVAIRRGIAIIIADEAGRYGAWNSTWAAHSPRPDAVWTYQPLDITNFGGVTPRLIQSGGVWLRTDLTYPGLAIQSREGGSWFDLARLPEVSGPFVVTPMDDAGRLAVIWRGSAPDLARSRGQPPAPAPYEIRELSAWTGEVFYAGIARAKGPISWTDFRLLSFILLAIMAIVLVVVIRAERPGAAIVLPEGVSLAEPGQRLASGLVDLLISGVATLWLLGVPWREALNPFWLLSTRGELAILAWVGIGLALGTLTEAWLGSSPGKFLTGACVIRCRPSDADPTKPPRMRGIGLRPALVRNAIKWLLPPVGAIGLMTQDSRHLGDIFAATAVIRKSSNDTQN